MGGNIRSASLSQDTMVASNTLPLLVPDATGEDTEANGQANDTAWACVSESSEKYKLVVVGSAASAHTLNTRRPPVAKSGSA